MTTQRGSCWSVTINNPTEQETQVQLHPGWKLSGQLETGEEGTVHFQGMLRTPQVRFSAVKALFPRAHIEVARNPAALAVYVQKEETRTAEWTQKSAIPTIFQFQQIVADRWNYPLFLDDWRAATYNNTSKTIDEHALMWTDGIVEQLIEEGQQGAEWIAINPMWRSSWKKFWRSIIRRNASQTLQQATPPAQETSAQE